MFSIAILTYTEIVKRYLLCHHDWKLEITMALIILQDNYQRKHKNEKILKRCSI